MTGILILAAAIQLGGVTGSDLRARAYFDANNVKVGDPLVLTLDFMGDADFRSIHPPPLSKAVNRKDWKVDDASAKTDTFSDGRRITYRIRPMRNGLLWFPSLEFSYETADGERTVRANAVPVHAKSGAQVVVEEMDEIAPDDPSERMKLHLPSDVRLAEIGLSPDELFDWRKSCATPSADAFARFGFPEARLNEAACALKEGNWSRALSVYRRLEWTTGQTPEIEKGIAAALALRYENPNASLPVWREVGRPVLRHSWRGRVAVALGAVFVVAFLSWLLSRGMRAMAAVAAAAAFLVPADASAQDIFEQMNRQMQQMRQAMNSHFSFSFGGETQEAPEVKASVEMSRDDVRVGDAFEFVISLEAPKTCSIGQIRITPSNMFGMTVTGQAENLADGVPSNPSNALKRISVPVRYDVPFSGKVTFRIDGMISSNSKNSRRGGLFASFSSFSTSFSAETKPISVKVAALPSDGQPGDFAGIVSNGLRMHETCNVLTVETNDVVVVTRRIYAKGFVPQDFLPPGSAFEWARRGGGPGDEEEIEYRGFFIADGSPATPKVSVPYYDPRTKTYKRVYAGGTPLKYVPSK